MFTWMNRNLAYGYRFPLALAVSACLFMFCATASATNWNNGDDSEATATARSDADAAAQAQAGAIAGANAEAGDSNAQSEASNEGNTLDAGDTTTSNNSAFFSFARSMPAAGRCFGTIDGGGGNTSGAGFLGFNYLNKDCWYAALADAEQNVEVRARLKCGGKKFRNAIAYDQPRKERQPYCIAFMSSTYMDQLTFERQQIEEALLAQTHEINAHTTEETERTSASTTRAVERCTECFGKK